MPDHTTHAATETLAGNTKKVANLLNSTNTCLEKDSASGPLGIHYVNAGRQVVYRLSDLGALLNANSVIPTTIQDGRPA